MRRIMWEVVALMLGTASALPARALNAHEVYSYCVISGVDMAASGCGLRSMDIAPGFGRGRQ